MKLTYEAFLNDPRLRERVLADARRQRAQAVHDLFAGAARYLKNLYAARAHLARQG